MSAGRPAARRGPSRPRAGAAVLVLVAVPVVAAWPVPSGAGAAGPVEQARQAARTATFSARVQVEWEDGGGRHSTSVDVRAGTGLVRVAGAPGTAPQLGDGWLLVTRAVPGTTPGALPPAAEAKYDIERGPGPEVAGRPTTLVVLRTAGEVRETLAVDDTTGLVLRRELFAGSARPVRTVTVTELDTQPPVLPAGSSVAADDRVHPVAPATLGSPYRVPEQLDGGYRRVGAFRRDGVVHATYSDGLHGLSLFVQPGRLDRDRLPAGGEAVRIGATAALRYTWAGGEVVTWESGPTVRTLVGDAAAAEVIDAARSVPAVARPSALERLRSASRQVAAVLGAG